MTAISLPTNISSVQSLSHIRLFATHWTAALQASLSITSSLSLLKLVSIESMMPFYHLILCRPLLLLPSVFPSITVFSNESVLPIRWPKYWWFTFSISPSSEYSGLMFFRMDWLDLLAVQGTLKCLLQHHSSEAINIIIHYIPAMWYLLYIPFIHVIMERGMCDLTDCSITHSILSHRWREDVSSDGRREPWSADMVKPVYQHLWCPWLQPN